jgi:hypothetical protein
MASARGRSPDGLSRMIGQRTLGSPLREICTMGSKRGDEFKKLRSLGEDTASKESDYSEAPQRANTSRLVPTHPSEQVLQKPRSQCPQMLGSYEQMVDG